MKLAEPVLLIASAAVFGWLIAGMMIRFIFWPSIPKKIGRFSIVGILPAMLPGLTEKLSPLVYALLKQKIQRDEINVLETTRPLIEEHVDHFLKIKLKESFPLLHGFIGEKTFGLFKTSFMDEVERLLPEVWTVSSEKIFNDFGKNLFEDKFRDLDWQKIEKEFRSAYAESIADFKTKGLVIGLIFGIIQAVIIYLVHSF